MEYESDAKPALDPNHDILVDARNLRGIAHPLRVRLLGMLREDGPATATMLAERLGESSGATSYHLRQLAEYGFIEDDAERGSGRERWWRARHQSTHFDPAKQATAEGALLSAEYMRSVARAYAARMEAWIDSFATVPTEWRDAATMSDYRLLVTPEEARALIEQLDAIGRQGQASSETAEDPRARPVSLQFQVLPNPRKLGAEEQRG
jgi:DNA-binding transcriptional ArsR family regulator